MKYHEFLNLPEKKKVNKTYDLDYNELIDQIGSQELEREAFVERVEQAIREVSLDNNALWEEQDKVDNLGVNVIAKAIYDALPKLIKGE